MYQARGESTKELQDDGGGMAQVKVVAACRSVENGAQAGVRDAG